MRDELKFSYDGKRFYTANELFVEKAHLKPRASLKDRMKDAQRKAVQGKSKCQNA